MKKVLSFFLAILMVLSLASTIVISASAEESKGDGSISVAMDSNKWDQCVLKENWEGQDKVQYRGFAAGSSHGAGGFMFRYGEGNTVAATDISGMKYIEFDVYVSNVADIANVEFSFELTSKGTADQQEISKKFTGASTGWTNGWNHVKWALTEFTGKTGGEFDATKWNFIRWYNDTTLKVGAEKLMVSIANLKFTVDTEIVVPSIDHAVPGWEVTPEKWNPAFDLKTPDGTNAYLLRKWDANATLGVNHYNMFWIVETDNGCVSFDVSTADTFALDMWISDVSMVTGKQFQIELANGGFGGIDTNEATYNGTLDALVEGGLQNGWNTIKLPIASMGKTGNGADWTKIDWFRLYNAENITTGANGLSVAIDNVRFLKGDTEVAVMSECEPTMNGWQKNARPIVIDGVEAMGQTWTSDIAAGGYFTFRNQSLKLDISDMKYVEFDVYVSDVSALANVNLMFELRSGTTAETNEWGINAFKAPEKGWVTGWNHVKWTLADMSKTASGEFDATNVVWFRIANHDAIPVDGSLTIAMDNLRFTTDAAPECKNCHVPHEIYLPKPGTTVAGWGWAANLELNNTVSVSNSYAANALVKFCDIYVEYKPATPVDASKADALTFDFYVSDVTGIQDATLEIEIASVSCDTEELNATGKVGALIEGGLKAGWNTVVMPFDKLIKVGGDIKLDNIKWFRIYNQPAQNGGEFTTGANGLTIALDNLRFTKNGEKVATLSDVNPDMKGWERNGTPIMIGDILAQGVTFAENVPSGAGFNFLYIPGADVTLNVAGMKYFEFDWYVSDAAAIADTTFVFELSSSGLPDNQEIGKIFKGSAMGLKNGWNRVRLTIADLADTAGNGAFNPEKFNFLRLFNDNAITVNGELTMAFTNIRFVDDYAPVVETPANPEAPVDFEAFVQLGDAFLADFNKYGKTEAQKATFQPDSSAPVKTALADAEMLAKWNWLWVYMLNNLKETNPNATSAYLTDAYPVLEKMINGDTTAILDNANARTSIRSYIHGFLNAMKGCGDLNTDFSVFSPDFSSATEQAKLLAAYEASKTPDEPDEPDTPDTPVTPDTPAKPELDGIVIPMDKGWDQCWKEENFHEEFAQIRVYGNGGTYGPGGFMFRYNEGGTKAEAVDLTKSAYIEFDVYVSDVSVIADVEFSFELTSSGTSDKEESAKKFKGKDTGWVNGWNHVKWSLDEFNVKNGEFDPSRWNFIRWYNDTTLKADGFFEVGIANLHFTQKSAEELDAEEATKTEHAVPLWGCNTGWDVAGEKWTVDNENPAAGSGCISVNLKDRVDVMAPEKHFETPIDGTGMDTLEFDIYLSDLAIVEYFSNTDGALELTSSGTSDQAEVAYNLRNFTKYVLADAQVGWNHVSIKIKNMESLDGAAGPFDISKINFIRFYWVYPPDCDQDWIIKLDNFRLTDKVAQEEAEKEAEADKILEQLADLVAEIDALQSIADSTVTAENYEAAKAQYNAVKTKYDALNDEQKAALTDKGYALKMSNANKPIKAYEETLAKMEELKDIIDSLKALEAYANASAFTNENYDAAKQQIQDVRKAYEALVRSDKKFLEDNGFLAYLTAAEAAMPAEKPATSTPDNGGSDNDNTNEGGTDTENKGGCFSTMTIGAVATMVLAGAWVTIAARKKEN